MPLSDFMQSIKDNWILTVLVGASLAVAVVTLIVFLLHRKAVNKRNALLSESHETYLAADTTLQSAEASALLEPSSAALFDSDDVVQDPASEAEQDSEHEAPAAQPTETTTDESGTHSESITSETK